LGPDASGFQRIIALDALAGRLRYPDQPNLTAQPGLIEQAHFSEDGRSVSLKVDSNRTFHNGRKINAADLAYSLNYHLRSLYETPELSAFKNIVGFEGLKPGGDPDTDLIEGIEIADGQTIWIRFKEADKSFLSNIRMPIYSVFPRECMGPPGSLLKSANRNSGSHLAWMKTPVGAGPYKLIEAKEEGKTLIMEAHGGFLKDQIQSNRAKSICLTTGKFEGAGDLLLGYLKNPDPDSYKLQQTNIPWVVFGIYFNFENPLARKDVFRKAVQRSIDSTALAASRAAGKPTQTILPSSHPAWATVNSRQTNLHKLNEAKANFQEVLTSTDPDEFVFAVPPTILESSPEMIATLEDGFEKAGAPFKAVPASDPRTKSAPFKFSGFIPSIDSAAALFSLFETGGSWVTRLDQLDTTYKDLLKKARTHPDRESTQNLDRHFKERAFAIPLFEDPVSCYVKSSDCPIRSLNEKHQDISIMVHSIQI
jgi:ABC-type transport system substrate-binding protein